MLVPVTQQLGMELTVIKVIIITDVTINIYRQHYYLFHCIILLI